MHRFMLVIATCLTISVGCASVPEYDVTLNTIPTSPIPAKAITATVLLSGASTSGASVSLVVAGTRYATSVDPSTAGQFLTHDLLLPTEGAHKVEIEISVDGAKETWEASLTASCSQDGGLNAPCCGPNACGANLVCVYGACASALAATDGRCHEGVECASGVCTDGICQAPTCTDGVKNGEELGVDCGTKCAVGCPSGTPCVVDTDCDTGFCAMGRCPAKPGELIGPIEDTTVSPTVTQILSQSMTAPNDLAFSTLDNNQLWVVDMAKDSFVIIFGAGQDGQSHQVILDKSQHFMERVTSISFADEPSFGTCGDTRNDYGGMANPNNFMGPVQWPSNINDYSGKQSAHQVHWDMLHSSPYCMGIASAGGTTYYVFNGYDNSIDWYDFKEPHCPGCDDHSDGVKRRFSGVSVKRVKGVPSNLEHDGANKLLYVADTGNARVL
ncbi:MAG TPA: hypothetical protein DCQ06_12215, partial [Myxococcales bacterium]|nr:hypothetical protein [Myxococcales bacterium]